MDLDSSGGVLGIDLSTQPKLTGAVWLKPVSGGRWSASLVPGLATDDVLTEAAASAAMVGIDSPLGWPTAFVEAVSKHHIGEAWTAPAGRAFTHRRTDEAVRSLGHQPLSVSTDKLGATAMRCARLQARFAEAWQSDVLRDGSGRLVEVYPAAALKTWGLPSTGYKAAAKAAGSPVREQIFDGISSAAAAWLDVQGLRSVCLASDDVLDGLVCALVALAATRDMTRGPMAADHESARTEGWIHLPTASLSDMGEV